MAFQGGQGGGVAEGNPRMSGSGIGTRGSEPEQKKKEPFSSAPAAYIL